MARAVVAGKAARGRGVEVPTGKVSRMSKGDGDVIQAEYLQL